MTEQQPQYRTFYDEILAAVPMDRWITHRELKAMLKPRGIIKNTIQTALARGKKEGILLSRSTGRKSTVPNQSLYFPVHEYVRTSSGRPLTSSSCLCRNTSDRGKKHNKAPKLKSTERKKFRPPATKLNEDQVRQIRLLRDQGATYTSIARAFGMYHQHIRKVCRGEYWKHVR